jgi:hypothetical protein
MRIQAVSFLQPRPTYQPGNHNSVTTYRTSYSAKTHNIRFGFDPLSLGILGLFLAGYLGLPLAEVIHKRRKYNRESNDPNIEKAKLLASIKDQEQKVNQYIAFFSSKNDFVKHTAIEEITNPDNDKIIQEKLLKALLSPPYVGFGKDEWLVHDTIAEKIEDPDVKQRLLQFKVKTSFDNGWKPSYLTLKAISLLTDTQLQELYFKQCLGHKDANVRRWAIGFIGEVNEKPDLQESLLLPLCTNPDKKIKETLVNTVRESITSPAVRQKLSGILKVDLPKKQAQALETLRSHQTITEPSLKKLAQSSTLIAANFKPYLEHKDSKMRILAIQEVGRMNDKPELQSELLMPLCMKPDKDVKVRNTLLQTIRRDIQDQELKQKLIELILLYHP